MKRRVIGFLDSCLIFLLLWGASCLSGSWVSWVQSMGLVVVGLCVLFWLWLFVQSKRHHVLVLLWGLLLLPGQSYAQTTGAYNLGNCVDKTGIEFYTCEYNARCTEAGPLIRTWANRLDPDREYNDEEKDLMKQISGQVDKLLDLQKILARASAGTGLSCHADAVRYNQLYQEWLNQHGGTGTENVSTVPLILSDAQLRCWTCDIILVFFFIIEHLVSNSLVELSQISLIMLGVMFGFWILFRVWRLTLDLSTAKNFYRDFLKQLGCVMVAAIILGNLYTRDSYRGSMLHGLFQLTINPIMNTVLGVGDLFSQNVFSNNNFFSNVQRTVEQAMPELYRSSYCSMDGNAGSALSDRLEYFFGVSDGGLSVRVFSNDIILGFLCLTQRIYNQLMPLTAVGSVIVSDQMSKMDSWWDAAIDWFRGHISIIQLIYGVIIYIFCFLLTWIIAFEILDIFLRLMFVFVLVPIWVTCAVFSVTRFYAKQTLKMFFSLMVDFLAVVFGVGIMLAMVQHFFPQSVLEELQCWIFDTTGALTAHCQTHRRLPAAIPNDVFVQRNSHYAENLYRAITREYGVRFILGLVAMFFLGKKVFFSARSVFRSLLGATTGVSLGGSAIFSSAAMRAQETTRRGAGWVLTVIPGFGVINTVVEGGGKLTDSLASAGTRSYEAVSNVAAKGINAMGTGVGNAISHGGAVAGTGLSAAGSAVIGAGWAVSAIPVVGWLLAPVILPAAYLIGGALKVLGVALHVGSKVAGALVKLSARISGWVLKASQFVVRGINKTVAGAVKFAGRTARSSIHQFFYFQGNAADKSRATKAKKAAAKKVKKYYHR